MNWFTVDKQGLAAILERRGKLWSGTTFLRTLNALVLNHVHADLTPETASAPWVQEAAGNAIATGEAVRAVVVKNYGEHAVIATPNGSHRQRERRRLWLHGDSWGSHVRVPARKDDP